MLALALTVSGCVNITPRPAEVTQTAVLPTDPRVDARVIREGEPSPGDGVWLNQWTYDALLAALQDKGR